MTPGVPHFSQAAACSRKPAAVSSDIAFDGGTENATLRLTVSEATRSLTVLAGSPHMTSDSALATAVLGGGCFWCLDAVFRELDGVRSVESGYAGGRTANPTYEDVCGGDTGHAEVVRVTFDPR